MKKFLKMSAVLTVLMAALTCFIACNASVAEDMASVQLGSNPDCFVKIGGNLYTRGGVADYWNSIALYTDSKDCPAEFNISTSYPQNFSIKVFENQSLNNSGTIYIYNKAGNLVGYVSITHIDGKLQLTYTEY